MQQPTIGGVSDAHAVISRTVGYVSGLYQIWVNTSDQQFITLSREFPNFYCYARITGEASDAGRNRASRPYDGMTEFFEQYKEMGAQLLAMADTFERDYQALRIGGNLQTFQPHPKELGRLHRRWLFDLDSFKNSLCVQGTEPKVLEYVNDALGLIAEHIKQLAGRSSEFSAVPASSRRACDF